MGSLFNIRRARPERAVCGFFLFLSQVSQKGIIARSEPTASMHVPKKLPEERLLPIVCLRTPGPVLAFRLRYPPPPRSRSASKQMPHPCHAVRYSQRTTLPARHSPEVFRPSFAFCPVQSSPWKASHIAGIAGSFNHDTA